MNKAETIFTVHPVYNWHCLLTWFNAIWAVVKFFQTTSSCLQPAQTVKSLKTQVTLSKALGTISDTTQLCGRPHIPCYWTESLLNQLQPTFMYTAAFVAIH